MATIAIDYDDTYTLDPDLWDAWIAIAKHRGHTVVCVTARPFTQENVAICKINGVQTFFTNLSAKDWYMQNKHFIKVDVWIDDHPQGVHQPRC